MRIAGGGGKGLGAAVAIAVLVGVGAAASPAAAAEQVFDGGFEQTICAPNDGFSCLNPGWNEGGTQSFVCKTSGCTTNTENFPRAGSGWLQLGGDIVEGNTETGTLTMTQPLVIPRAPATLSYWVRRYGGPSDQVFSTFSVRLDDQVVLGSAISDPPGGPPEALDYQQFTIDLSPLAGPEARVLSLHTDCVNGAALDAPCDVFLVDDVSVTIPDPPATNPPVTHTPSTEPSRKCGKKKGKRKGKKAASAKCKKRNKRKKKG